MLGRKLWDLPEDGPALYAGRGVVKRPADDLRTKNPR